MDEAGIRTLRVADRTEVGSTEWATLDQRTQPWVRAALISPPDRGPQQLATFLTALWLFSTFVVLTHHHGPPGITDDLLLHVQHHLRPAIIAALAHKPTSPHCYDGETLPLMGPMMDEACGGRR